MDFLTMFRDPRILHAAAVHFPVALGVLGFPLIAAAAVAKMRPTLRQIVLAVYLLLALAAFVATTTGSVIPVKSASPIVDQSLQTHSMIAKYVWMGAMATAVFVLLTAIRSEWFRAMFTMLGVLCAIATTALVVATALYGQALVYEHGLGAKPKPPVQAVATPPPPAPVPKAPAPPIAVIEPVAPKEEKELDTLSPKAEVPPDLSPTTSPNQPKTVETINNEALASLKNRHIPRMSIEKPTQTYSERARLHFTRAKRWIYNNLWPF